MLTEIEILAAILGAAAASCGVLFLDTFAMWFWSSRGNRGGACPLCGVNGWPVRITTLPAGLTEGHTREFCLHCGRLTYENHFVAMTFKSLEEIAAGSL